MTEERDVLECGTCCAEVLEVDGGFYCFGCGTPDPVPVLDAYPHGQTQWRVRCRHCRRWHYHSIGEGHRRAHCWRPSPFKVTGYILRLVAPSPFDPMVVEDPFPDPGPDAAIVDPMGEPS